MLGARMCSGVLVCIYTVVLLIPVVSAAEFLKGVSMATVKEIEADIKFALAGAHDMGHRNISVIERSLSTSFEALPKNHHGLLERPALNYLLHRYFLKEYGWVVKGLTYMNNDRNLTGVTDGIRADELPSFIERSLENRHASGFSLQDAAVAVSVLDHVILNEHVVLLQAAYALRGFDTAGRQNLSDIDTILSSYRILYHVGGSLTDSRKHMKLLNKVMEVHPVWNEYSSFFDDAVQSFIFLQTHTTNLFTELTFTFQDTWAALSEAMRLFGKYEDLECLSMKRSLTEMDPGMSGRVPLGRFYRSGLQHGDQFSESVDYLRSLGALDESVGGSSAPQVLISNYMLSASNCAKSTPYYSVCCKSECDLLMEQLEEAIAAPTATAAVIIRLVQDLPSPSVEVPSNLSDALVSALFEVSAVHGDVHLHGRLFAQWMHYAYPHECPYPHASNVSVSSMTSVNFKAQTGQQWKATEEEMSNHVEALATRTIDPHMSQWNPEEELYAGASKKGSGRMATWAIQACILACIALALWEAGTRMLRITGHESAVSKAARAECV